MSFLRIFPGESMRCAVTVSLCLSLLLGSTAAGQLQPPPRLVVYIVLDQFPYEYLTRFRPSLGTEGFARIMNNGASFTNVLYAHANTSTGPGHAVLSTGAYGTVNGIVGNNWFDNRTGKMMYCVADSTVKILGGSGSGRSPANLQTLTFGDELRIATGFKGKVFSLSNKDRAAILLGGKYANCALWMRDSAFVTSTYYCAQLPEWVRKMNASGLINSYFGRQWERSLPIPAFQYCDTDSVDYENGENGMGTAFPHRVTGNDPNRITSSYYDALMTSPYGSEVLAAYARTAIREEHLGKRGVTDLLCVSLSATDYVGHHFGPHSWEILEMVVQTDRILSSFLKFLDKEIGLANCLVVLSSDHAVSQIPNYLTAASGRKVLQRVSYEGILAACESTLTASFGAPASGTKWVAGSANRSLSLSRRTLADRNVTPEQASILLKQMLINHKGIAAAYTRDEIEHLVPFRAVETRMKNSYLRARSGDVTVALLPIHVEMDDHKGATHGQPYESDAHVPLLIMGTAVKKGVYSQPAAPADIAPTLSALTGVEFTPGCQGRVLFEAIKTN
jgi:predicted AlkP superfamily pyrophosphatase or phosphodiesterase